MHSVLGMRSHRPDARLASRVHTFPDTIGAVNSIPLLTRSPGPEVCPPDGSTGICVSSKGPTHFRLGTCQDSLRASPYVLSRDPQKLYPLHGLCKGAHYRQPAQIVPDQWRKQLGGHGVPVLISLT